MKREFRLMSHRKEPSFFFLNLSLSVKDPGKTSIFLLALRDTLSPCQWPTLLYPECLRVLCRVCPDAAVVNVGGTFFSAAQLVCKMMKRAERGGLETEDFYIWIYANVAKDVELETIRDTPPMLRFMLFLSERRKKKRADSRGG